MSDKLRVCSMYRPYIIEYIKPSLSEHHPGGIYSQYRQHQSTATYEAKHGLPQIRANSQISQKKKKKKNTGRRRKKKRGKDQINEPRLCRKVEEPPNQPTPTGRNHASKESLTHLTAFFLNVAGSSRHCFAASMLAGLSSFGDDSIEMTLIRILSGV
jgi:hypothetical protein